jgi:UDP-N-acetylmuramate dehydrogenase
VRDEDRQAIAHIIGSDGEVRFDEPMARHSTLRIGGPADVWVAPAAWSDLARLRQLCAERGIVTRAYGSGSNLLVRDGGIRGVAVSLKLLNEIGEVARGASVTTIGEREEWVEIECGAGASTGKLLGFATRAELGGLEFLGGVPGTVGGGMIMNAGTYLGEFKDVTRIVYCIAERGEVIERPAEECGFAYRHSSIPPSDIVVGARLRLPRRSRVEIEKAVRDLRDRRKAREPHGVPNAGSIFKNPPNDYAGRLIEQCGLKGRRVGGAEVSPVHANWLVNADGATARDMLGLVEIVRAAVVERFGITLELEVKVVGEDSE